MPTDAQPSLRGRQSGAEMAYEMAGLILGTFGSVDASDEDQAALADHLIHAGVTWVNDKFKIGLAP